MSTANLPTGYYLICANSEHAFYAGRRASSPARSCRSPNTYTGHWGIYYPEGDNEEAEAAAAVAAKKAKAQELFYYSTDSAADFAFLDDLDGDSPWALAARAREAGGLNAAPQFVDADSPFAAGFWSDSSVDTSPELSSHSLSPISEIESLPSSPSMSEVSMPRYSEEELARYFQLPVRNHYGLFSRDRSAPGKKVLAMTVEDENVPQVGARIIRNSSC